jgi:hypothetical protein
MTDSERTTRLEAIHAELVQLISRDESETYGQCLTHLHDLIDDLTTGPDPVPGA